MEVGEVTSEAQMTSDEVSMIPNDPETLQEGVPIKLELEEVTVKPEVEVKEPLIIPKEKAKLGKMLPKRDSMDNGTLKAKPDHNQQLCLTPDELQTEIQRELEVFAVFWRCNVAEVTNVGAASIPQDGLASCPALQPLVEHRLHTFQATLVHALLTHAGNAEHV